MNNIIVIFMLLIAGCTESVNSKDGLKKADGNMEVVCIHGVRYYRYTIYTASAFPTYGYTPVLVRGVQHPIDCD